MFLHHPIIKKIRFRFKFYNRPALILDVRGKKSDLEKMSTTSYHGGDPCFSLQGQNRELEMWKKCIYGTFRRKTVPYEVEAGLFWCTFILYSKVNGTPTSISCQIFC